jgi:hypothetical protein
MAFIYDLTDTWNAGGTTFNAIKMNVTDTASAAGSKLVTLQVGGAERFTVDKAGNASVAGTLTLGSALSVANGGTGVTTSTGTGSVVLNTSPTLVTPALGTPSSATLTNATGLPIVAGTTGTLSVARGGTGATTFTANRLLRGNGTGALQLAGIFDQSSAEAMRIDSAGNVGIGLTSPSGLLHVYGSGSTRFIVEDAVEGGCAFRVQTGGSSVALFAAATPFSTTARNIIFATGTTERMRITSAGLVGIGTTTPSDTLSVAGTLGVTSNTKVSGVLTLDNQLVGTGAGLNLLCQGGGSLVMRSDDFSGVSKNIRFRQSVSDTANIHWIFSQLDAEDRALAINCSSGAAAIKSSTNLLFQTGSTIGGATERMRITQAGEVYIAGTTDQGAYNLQVNGTGVWGAGAYVNGSDRNLKDEIAPLADALDLVNELKPVTFRYKEEYSKDQSIQPGFIAQELQEALAEQVYLDGVVQAGPEHLNVAYQSLIPVLVKAIQELTARVAQLEGN